MKKILTVTVFAVIIFSVFFASLILPSDEFSKSERRALAAFPERLYGISRLHEGTLLRYDIQGVRLIKK